MELLLYILISSVRLWGLFAGIICLADMFAYVKQPKKYRVNTNHNLEVYSTTFLALFLIIGGLGVSAVNLAVINTGYINIQYALTVLVAVTFAALSGWASVLQCSINKKYMAILSVVSLGVTLCVTSIVTIL